MGVRQWSSPAQGCGTFHHRLPDRQASAVCQVGRVSFLAAQTLQVCTGVGTAGIGTSFIQRTTGFGFGIFIMTVLPFLLPSYGEATTISGQLAITTSAAIVWRLRGYVTWNRLWPILVTFIIVSTIAIFALTRIEDHILRRILGVALILISIYFMLFSPPSLHAPH